MTGQRIVILACASFVLSACFGNHYEVTDPASGQVYYTTKVSKERGGYIEFKNETDDHIVAIRNPEVREIDKKSYKANTAQD